MYIWLTLLESKTMKKKVSVFNFSGIYEKESFYLKDKGSYLCDTYENIEEPKMLDFSSLAGTNCFCDDIARDEIRKTITENGIRPDEIHFIDNGNYHYMSAILTEQIKEPFSLIVLDHHPDMQPPMFGDILSCGGWVLDVLEKNEYVRDIHVIGADRDLISKLDESIKNKAKFYDLEDIFDGEVRLPETLYLVYLSIDKDVVTRDELTTNWDQGQMTIDQLKEFVKKLQAERNVIGIDICGECAPNQEDCDVDKATLGNDQLNDELLRLLCE